MSLSTSRVVPLAALLTAPLLAPLASARAEAATAPAAARHPATVVVRVYELGATRTPGTDRRALGLRDAAARSREHERRRPVRRLREATRVRHGRARRARAAARAGSASGRAAAMRRGLERRGTTTRRADDDLPRLRRRDTARTARRRDRGARYQLRATLAEGNRHPRRRRPPRTHSSGPARRSRMARDSSRPR